MMNIGGLIYGIGSVLFLVGIILPIIFLIFICMNIRPLASNVLSILICNTYLALTFSSTTIFYVTFKSFLNHLNVNVFFGMISCQIDTYLLHVGLCSVTYSFILQSLFRLFRIVFFQNRTLRSLRFFSILILIQWIFIFPLNFPFIFLNDFQYLPDQFRCDVPYTNIRGTAMVIILIYIFPISLIFGIYYYIIRYIRQTTNAMQYRQNRNQRDIVVFKRIIFLFIVMQILSTPLCIVWILYMITGNTTSWNYYLQILCASIGNICVAIILASATQQIRNKFKRRRQQIYPGNEIRMRQRNTQEFGHQHSPERV